MARGPLVEPAHLPRDRREPVPVQEAFRLKFEGGGSLVLGPGNWVLVRRDLPKGEVAIQRPVDDLHPGDELVSGVDDRALRTVRLQVIEPEGVVPGKSPPYFLIRAENLSWAKVGGVLVSIEAQLKDDDAAAEGLASATTTLALRKRERRASVPRDRKCWRRWRSGRRLAFGGGGSDDSQIVARSRNRRVTSPRNFAYSESRDRTRSVGGEIRAHSSVPPGNCC